MSDPAGWYPDPTGRHELRYWDGYAWLDDISDQGTAGKDALGGKPMPAPSEAAAKAQAAPPPSPSASRTPVYVIAAAVAVVVVIVVAFLVLRGGGGDSTTTLKDKPVTFADDVKDAQHPTIHRLHIKANTVVLMNATAENKELTPAFVVLTDQKTVDSVNSKVEGVKDLLTDQLRDACSNLREEDIGAKGTVVYFANKADNAGEELKTFMVVITEGDYEVVPVLVDKDGKCEGGKSSLTLDPRFLDFSSVSNSDDLGSVLSNDSDLSSFFSS